MPDTAPTTPASSGGAASAQRYRGPIIHSIVAGVLLVVPVVVWATGLIPGTDVLMMGIGPAMVALVIAGLSFIAAATPVERRPLVLARTTLVMAIVGPALFYGGLAPFSGPFAVAFSYPVSGGGLVLTPVFWFLPLGIALSTTSLVVAIVGLVKRWPKWYLILAVTIGLVVASPALLTIAGIVVQMVTQYS